MKKIYAISASVLMASAMFTNAQQLPNSGFEEEWGDCTPWTFYQSEENYGQQSAFVNGTTPKSWVVSNVSGMVSYYDGSASGLGATVVGEKVEGYNSATAVKLTNSPNPFMASQIVPGYISTGTTWSTANPALQSDWSIQINNSDGGSFGGQAFTGRPVALEFMYKRSRGEDKPAEKSTVVAYLWKGHWTQKEVPAIIYMAGSPYCVDMVDRDRCVLGMGMEGCQGGEVTKTDDAELIAVINVEITEDASEWTKFHADFEYKSDATPEMINIVIAAGDYFGGASVVGKDNSLTVDDVKLIYAGETEADKYPGTLNIEMLGGNIAENQAADVEIAYDGDDKCTLTLPNFSLDLGNGVQSLGDIVVPNVAVSTVDNVAKYTGEVKGLQLMGGIIEADATVDGTIDSEGVANFKISVLWNNIPINVTFTGKGKPGKGTTAGIGGVAVEDESVAEYYNLQGVRVDASNLTPGYYVVRKGAKVSKILVR